MLASGTFLSDAGWLHRKGSGKLYKARSRLQESQNLQLNVRLKALAEIYKMRSFAQLIIYNVFQPFSTFFSEKVGYDVFLPIRKRGLYEKHG